MKLRDARGNLTPAGTQFHDREEVPVLVPAVQIGDSSTGEQYRIETTKTFTEDQYPQIGDVFRRAGGSTEQRSARVVEYLRNELDPNQELLEASAQQWRYDPSRNFTVRVRKRVGNELRVSDIPLRHEFPLRYDFMLRHTKLLHTQVVMERDCKAQDLGEWQWWQNEVRPGVFWTEESLTSLSGEWLREGVVPQACATGFDKYSWLRRYCGEGKEICEVHQVSPFSCRQRIA